MKVQSGREIFNSMINEALRHRPDFILMDDSSRFSRSRRDAIILKEKLRTNGIEILYANEPNIDPQSVAGLWYEGIKEIKNEATSREIRFHTMKGMIGNIQHRDPDTQWCYKNGGRPPYGSVSVSLQRGKDSKGKDVFKTVWDLDPDAAHRPQDHR